jgi:acetoin utilization deacetylase AcuC-like enzyme
MYRKLTRVLKKVIYPCHKMDHFRTIHTDQIAVDFKDGQFNEMPDRWSIHTGQIANDFEDGQSNELTDFQSIGINDTNELYMAKKNGNELTDSQSIKAPDTNELYMANKVGIFWHGDCLLHKIVDHPEQPDRCAFILKTLRQNYPKECFRSAPLITDSQILLFHTPEHLSMLKKKFETSESAFNKNNIKDMYKSIDGDTVVMWRTCKAVYRAAGSVIAAIDALLLPDGDTNKIMSAFCCVRPPGHHAHRGKAGGFCFMNNAGIGARYAQSVYEGIKKVAVLDFDVHHGDGVEEGFAPHENLFYGSTHEKDNFPGTGTDPFPFVGENARNELDRRIVNRTINRGPDSVKEFHLKWVEVIEEMILFKPDLIIISAGFDAHDEDPLASCELYEEDFSWATEVVMKAAFKLNPHSPIPVMSVLEGGYDLPALASSALAHVNMLAKGHPLLKTEKVDEAHSIVIKEEDVKLEETLGTRGGEVKRYYISGQILELYDLVLTEMNNVRVEIDGMKIVEDCVQYHCIFTNNVNEKHWIPECNIREISMATFSELKIYGDLRDEIQVISVYIYLYIYVYTYVQVNIYI